MSESSKSKSQLPTFLGSLGAILIFLLIMLVAYLPNRPEPVDAQQQAERLQRAEETRAENESKLEGYEVVNAEEGTVRIPIEQAMELTLKKYRNAPAEDGGAE